eukprot:scaffold29846_cov45-Phaeocystis_antarctica.AAC.3
MGADTKANTSGAAAHLRSVIFVSLRMAASAEAPSTPSSLPTRLRARDTMETRTLGGGGALEVGDLCLLEDGSERSDALVSDLVPSET